MVDQPSRPSPAPKAGLGGTRTRAQTLWELALHLPRSVGPVSRDYAFEVGSGSDERFQSSIRLATGIPLLAHAVVRGEVDVAMANPSGGLTQAYRGTGMFQEPLPVRILACFPSWDRFVVAMHPRTGLTSFTEIKERRYPLRVSLRKDPNHSTRFLLNDALAYCGFSLEDLQSWGGSLVLSETPNDEVRQNSIRNGEVDAVLDEGIKGWFPTALSAGFEAFTLEEPLMRHLEGIGWRRVTIPASRFPGLKADFDCFDYSGWPIYTRESLPEEQAYAVCEALAAAADEIPWEMDSFSSLHQLWQESEATPMDVPLHPGAERWYQEHAASL